jgi:hypothetical protein
MIKTQYASACRSEKSRIERIYAIMSGAPIFHELMRKLDQYVFILDKNRQVVYVNQSVMDAYGFQDINDILGKRVGEIFDCRFAKSVSGCGTSAFCRECGAVNAILDSQLHHMDKIEECTIISVSGKVHELAVSSKPFFFDCEEFTLFSLRDISEEKRFRILEDIFFHDIANIASSLYSMIQLMNDERIEDSGRLNDMLLRASQELVSELNSHKLLKAAEENELIVNEVDVNSLEVINKIVDFAENAHFSKGNIIYVHSKSANCDFQTDISLLNRVITNMITNALEASSFGEKVTIGCDIKDRYIVFWVHNQAVIPSDMQSKIFCKSFTTKKRGSGMGTHSIKILTEKYLKGKAEFISKEGIGTVFSVKLPLK